jgi:hypothetical protein
MGGLMISCVRGQSECVCWCVSVRVGEEIR